MLQHKIKWAMVAVLGIAGPLAFGDMAMAQQTPADKALEKKIDALPNPYNAPTQWGQLPAGQQFGAVIAANPGPGGNMYVLHRCHENSCIGRKEAPLLVFTPDGKFVRSWGSGMFAFPHGFFLDKNNHIWTADMGSNLKGVDTKGHGNQIYEFDSNGKLLLTLGKAAVAGAPAQGMFTQPTGVVTNDKGEIFIAEGHDGTSGNRISKFTKDGKFIKSWGSTGSGPGQMRVIHAIALDNEGRLLVADRNNNRIDIFDQDGKFLTEWKQFGRPSNLYVTADDTLYVSDNESGDKSHPGWRKGIRIGSAKDGSVKYFVPIPDAADQPAASGAEGVGVGTDGSLYAVFVGTTKIEKYTRK